MATFYEHKPAGESVRAFFERKYTFVEEGTGTRHRLLDLAVVGLREAYGAVEITEGDARRVYAIVNRLSFAPGQHDNFGYKPQDERMGPVEDECPARILDLLTPTDNQTAIEWRERARTRLAARARGGRLTTGAVVEFADDLEFADGHRARSFRVEDLRRGIFTSATNGERYRIGRRTLARRVASGIAEGGA